MFDTSLEKEIHFLKERLRKLKAHDPELVFTCPKCGDLFINLSNYKELGMCAKCFVKKKTKELQDHADSIKGGTIEAVEIDCADDYAYSPNADMILIKNIIIKTLDGKTVKLKKPPEVTYIL